MKNILFIIVLILPLHSFCQELPADSLILKCIFGKTDKDGKTYTCPYDGNENIYSYEKSLVYRISFKTAVTLDNKDLILTIAEAPYGTQHGHQFGIWNIYFFKSSANGLVLVDSIKSDGPEPIGDKSEFEIVDIGKNRKAIIFTFQSTGNQHFENTKYVDLLTIHQLKYLMTINSEYDNSVWKMPDSDTAKCSAEKFRESFEILKSDKEWYDIRVHRVDYKFTAGCQNSVIASESEKVYVYTDGKYTERKQD